MPLGARTIWAGVLLAASLGAQSPTTSGAGEAARPLTPQGLDNLRALARMFGFVRYFYPSDQAATADWSRVAVDAVRAVEPAVSPSDLAKRLESVFAPMAPTVRVVPAGMPRPMMEMQSGPFVVLWQYRGLGPPQGKPGTPFFGARFLVPATQAPLIAFAPFHEDLPGGVSCMVPMALYRPQGPLAQGRALPPPPGSAGDRTVRLAAAIVAWNALEHFYPYFEELGPVWMAALGPLLSKASEDADPQAFHATLRKMGATLRDGQWLVNGPGAPPDAVPPVVWTVAEGHIVAAPVAGAAEVHPGDALLSIDGKLAADVLAAATAAVPGSTPQFQREHALPYLLARAAGAKVRVEIEPAAAPGSRKTVTLECTARAADLHAKRPDKLAEVEPGIFYLDLSRLTDTDFNAAVPALGKAHGLIFDLREGMRGTLQFAPLFGHLLTRPVQGPPTADPIVTRPDGAETIFQDNQWVASPIPPYFGAKRAFLAGGRTSGFAETILAIAAWYKLGEIVGEASGGANGTVNAFTVPGGYEVSFTGERVRQYDGSALFGVGIRPTIPVPLTRAGIAAGRDETLERAIQAVR